MQKQQRVVIDHVSPEINGGEFSIKRVVGQVVNVSADVLADGHDVVAASILYKHQGEKKWQESRMSPGQNDDWFGSFKVEKQGQYAYKIESWVEYAALWKYGIGRKIADGQHVSSELAEGVLYVEEVMKKASSSEKTYLKQLLSLFGNEAKYQEAVSQAVSESLKSIFEKYPQKILANTSKELGVYVDRKKALFSTWYEFFPRSSSEKEGKHGTFKECIPLLNRVAEMGFDTLYFPPVHPIGEVNRKGKNKTTTTQGGDVG